MTRTRVVAFLVVLGVCGVGLTALMAAKGVGDHPDPAASPAETRVTCLGHVDTEDRGVAGLFPGNFPIPSTVKKVLVKEAAFVRADQPLLEFDDKMLKLKNEEADIAINIALNEQAKAEATLKGHKAQTDAAELELQSKEEEFKSKKAEFDETKRLFDLKSKNKLELEAAEAAVKSADLNLQAARIKWQGLKDNVPSYLVEEAKENVKRMQSLKDQAQHALAQQACKAPADGTIIRSFVTEGTMFGPQTKEPAFWFLKEAPLVVRAEVNQEFARRVALGASASIEDESDSQQKWTGKVIKVSDQFLPKRNTGGGMPDLMVISSDDRVLECLVSIDPAPGKPGPRFGQKVRVTLAR
ncbi:MAG TPA: hypothetical protein VKE40_26490 [Gemmataceae bacterium]|nr:hypothetical protein [Gemmataceae bacterium]